jgi:MtN3 and saliva related transmembrane protein
MWIEAIGWMSSVVLVATIGKQVWKQWVEGASEGVSKWLFIGQTVASLGFTLYSALVKNWVFLASNVLMLGNGVLGSLILARNRRRKARGPAGTRAGAALPVGRTGT